MKNWKPTPPKFAAHKAKIFKETAKTSQFIYQIGEYEELHSPSPEVDLKKIGSVEINSKISYLKKCLLDFRRITGHGRGITGVQVGIPERISVMYISDEFRVIINPRVLKSSGEKYIYPEMCMSALPIIAPVARPARVEVEYLDEKGVVQVWNGKDTSNVNRMMNRVIQHEMDHMDGIINIDLVKNPSDLFLESDPNFYDIAKFEKII
ncbi:MAG TPA: peptide deformylase [Patescibacteria group bacterium]|nr:peptide deformylase [Patescibacteria group bacterium]